jgi:hypothetical protein
MDKARLDAIKDDFLTWSGGFPPDSEQHIFIYLEYAYDANAGDEDEVRKMLRVWMVASDSSPLE